MLCMRRSIVLVSQYLQQQAQGLSPRALYVYERVRVCVLSDKFVQCQGVVQPHFELLLDISSH